MPWPFAPVVSDGTDLNPPFFQEFVDQLNEAHDDTEAVGAGVDAVGAGLISLSATVAKAWTVSASAPSSPTQGDQYFDTDNNRIWAYNGSAWVLIGGSVPRARAFANAAQSLTTGTNNVISMAGEEYDTDGLHSTSSDTGRMTIPAGLGGIWLFSYTIVVGVPAPATGVAAAWLEKNAAGGYPRQGFAQVGQNATGLVLTGSGIFNLAAGDYVNVVAFQNTGGNQNVSDGAGSTSFTASYVGPA